MTRVASVLVAGVGLAAASDALASGDASCGRTERPWVKVDATEVPASLAAFVSLLRAELASRGLELCTDEGGPSPPVAAVRVSSRPDAVTLAVEVRDAVTNKQVMRDVALAGIPADGRPLTVALAADELLRASWAELALRTAPPPARSVPEPVASIVRDSVPSPAARRAPIVQLGVGFAWEQYARGMTLYGADARLGAWIVPRVELALELGLRNGPTATATDGTVKPDAWSLGAAGIVTLTPPDGPWRLDGVAVLSVERLTLAPSPVAGATGAEQSGYAVLAGLGPQGSFAVLPALRVGVRALALLPLRGVDAEDAGARFVGIEGPGWAAQLGVYSAL
jgi:hypothetical protein